MMRVSSSSDIKKSGKKSMDRRTTKTKASANKPDLFGISLARNKHNPNPVLFNSVKKDQNPKQFRTNKQSHYQSEKKPLIIGSKTNIFQQLNTKISFDYINSLYSDLGVHLGCKFKDKLQNKENILAERNMNVTVVLHSKEEKQCRDKIKSLIELKGNINSAYNSMKNTQNLFTYIVTTDGPLAKVKDQITSIYDIHKSISQFLMHFQSTQKQLQLLEHQFEEYSKEKQSSHIEQIEDQQQEQLDFIIQNLKNQIALEKKLCLRYQKEEKFLMGKLYYTQKKNNDLRASSSNLKIKNNNLRDTLKFTLSASSKKPSQSPKPQRSFSVKLQRVKRYNLEEEPISMIQNPKSERQLNRSKSTSSLNSARRCSFAPTNQKQTFLDKIY